MPSFSLFLCYVFLSDWFSVLLSSLYSVILFISLVFLSILLPFLCFFVGNLGILRKGCQVRYKKDQVAIVINSKGLDNARKISDRSLTVFSIAPIHHLGGSGSAPMNLCFGVGLVLGLAKEWVLWKPGHSLQGVRY